MAVKRVFAGYYKRYDGKRIYVVRVVKDINTGDAVVICKDASFIREGKYIRQTRREVEPEMI